MSVCDLDMFGIERQRITTKKETNKKRENEKEREREICINGS